MTTSTGKLWVSHLNKSQNRIPSMTSCVRILGYLIQKYSQLASEAPPNDYALQNAEKAISMGYGPPQQQQHSFSNDQGYGFSHSQSDFSYGM